MGKGGEETQCKLLVLSLVMWCNRCGACSLLRLGI